MIKNITKEDLYQQLADEHGVSVAKVRKAAESQFKFVARTIKHEPTAKVRLRYFGVFQARPYKIKAYLDGKDENN